MLAPSPNARALQSAKAHVVSDPLPPERSAPGMRLRSARGAPAARGPAAGNPIHGTPSNAVLRALACLVLSLLPWLTACASSGSDIHLAPLYSRQSTAGGGVRSELLFGALLRDQPDLDSEAVLHAVRPLVSWQSDAEGTHLSHFLVPLGRNYKDEDQSSSIFYPFYFWRSEDWDAGGESWEFLSLLGTYAGRDRYGDLDFAWFPFGGEVERFLTYDRIRFVLFPLYASAERNGRSSKHFLYPVLGWTTGNGESSFRLWPLYGRSRIEDNYDRRFYLWPFFHYHRNKVQLGPEREETKWMFWPIFGKTKRESYRSWTWLWPFFGFARDKERDFWALDFPWPLVRIQSGGTRPRAEERVRVWPFYSHFKNQSLTATTVLWPVFHWREEDSEDYRRDSFHVVPFWRSSVATEKKTEKRLERRLLWPLFRWENDAGVRSFHTLELNPFNPHKAWDLHYGWLYQLWACKDDGNEIQRERSWGGLWRREADEFEDRRSFTGLWSKRTLMKSGLRVDETSLLFGLIRWRHAHGVGREWLRPAFPGPGWPARREGDLPPATDNEPQFRADKPQVGIIPASITPGPPHHSSTPLNP